MTSQFRHLLDEAYSFSPEPRDLFEQHYVTAFERVQRCFGDALFNSRIPGAIHREQPISHAGVSLAVATQSMFILNGDSSYRAWQQGQSTDITRAWSRALWRYALILPVGYVVSRHSVRASSSAPSWNPALNDLTDYAAQQPFSVLDSNRTLSASSIAFATFQRLFPDAASFDSMLAFAVADAFSPQPNVDNPIASAFRRALHKVISHHRHLVYPYWWCFLHNDHLAQRDDFRPLYVNRSRPVPVPSPPPVDASQTARPADVAAQPSAPPQPAAPVVVAAPRPASEPPPVDPAVIAALEAAAQAVNEGIFKVNCKGALFHVIDGALHAVVPAFYDRVAAHLGRPGVDGEALQRLMRQSQAVLSEGEAEPQFRIYFRAPGKPAPVGTAHVVRLADSAARVVLPALATYSDNPAISRASAA